MCGTELRCGGDFSVKEMKRESGDEKTLLPFKFVCNIVALAKARVVLVN